jgi:hypothetical protein
MAGAILAAAASPPAPTQRPSAPYSIQPRSQVLHLFVLLFCLGSNWGSHLQAASSNTPQRGSPEWPQQERQHALGACIQALMHKRCCHTTCLHLL